GPVAFSTDGRTVAYAAQAKEGGEWVIVNDHAYGPYPNLIGADGRPSLFFLAGSSHVVYVVPKNDLQVVMVDGLESSQFACMLDQRLSATGFTFYGCLGNTLEYVTLHRKALNGNH